MAELSLVVKATLVLAVALLAVRLSGRASAAVRSLMLACAFGLLLLLPAVSAVLPARSIEVAAYSVPFEQAVRPPAAAVTGAPVTADVPAPVLPARSGMPSLRAVLLVVWAAGVVACAAPLVVGLFRLRRLRTHGRPWREAALPSSVEVLLHDEVRVPVTCGVFRPVIALPVDAPQWSGSSLRRVLLHELEHVRRRDWPVHLAARGICALYWFHPLVWIAWRRLCLESERACDDAVLREGDGAEYAAQLVALARRVTKHEALPLLSMAGRSNLSTRIGAMLAGNLARGPVRGVPAAALAGLAAMAALGLGPLQAVSSI